MLVIYPTYSVTIKSYEMLASPRNDRTLVLNDFKASPVPEFGFTNINSLLDSTVLGAVGEI